MNVDAFNAWAIATFIACLFFIWFIGYDDGPNAHKKTPRKERKKRNRK